MFLKKNFLSIQKSYINHGLFTRLGGLSKKQFKSLNCSISNGTNKKIVFKNRLIASKNLILDKKKLILIKQTHSTKVVRIPKNNFNKSLKADGMITSLNDIVLGVLTGLTIAITGINLPIAILTFLKFSYSCAAPLALFALGIILAKSKLTDNLNFALNISMIKVLIHPVRLAVIGFGVLELSLDDLKPGLMVAAAPCGAMVLVFASAYNVDPKPLAPLVVISFLLSLPGLALVIFL